MFGRVRVRRPPAPMDRSPRTSLSYNNIIIIHRWYMNMIITIIIININYY